MSQIPPIPEPPGRAPPAPPQPGAPWPGVPYQTAPPNNGMAVASMVLGILGLVMIPIVGAILALVFGYIAKGNIDRSHGREVGRGMAVAGIVMGYVGLLTSIGWIAYFIWFFNHFDSTFHDIIRHLPTPSP